MKSIRWVSLLLILFFGSCVTMIKWKYGIHNPREETPATILGFLKKMNRSDCDVFLFSDSASYCHYLGDPRFRKNLIGSLFFNEKGLMFNVKDSVRCQWSAGYFVRNLKTDTVYETDNTFRYQDLLKQLTPLSGDAIPADSTSRFDFVTVITWATFAGKLNERLFAVAEAARENKHARIRIVFLNFDMQKSWKLNSRQKLVIK